MPVEIQGLLITLAIFGVGALFAKKPGPAPVYMTDDGPVKRTESRSETITGIFFAVLIFATVWGLAVAGINNGWGSDSLDCSGYSSQAQCRADAELDSQLSE